MLGIGLSFSDHKRGLEVAEVIKNSPAARAGIQVGMLVTHVDGKDLKFIPVDKAFSMLEGEAGSQVSLTISAKGEDKPQIFDLEREVILLESVSSQILPDRTGYISISQFTLNSYKEFNDAIEAFDKNSNIDNLIIDLRDNPGGVMDVAIELSDLFIDSGKLLISTGRTDDSNHTYYAKEAAPLQNLNVLVMINGGSASASEIMAAALQDHKKAIIFGENSYGKGTIQSIVSLNEDSGLKLTTAEYFSPLGNKIQDIGVKPDYSYQQKAAKNTYSVSLLDDPQLLQAYNLLSKVKAH